MRAGHRTTPHAASATAHARLPPTRTPVPEWPSPMTRATASLHLPCHAASSSHHGARATGPGSGEPTMYYRRHRRSCAVPPHADGGCNEATLSISNMCYGIAVLPPRFLQCNHARMEAEERLRRESDTRLADMRAMAERRAEMAEQVGPGVCGVRVWLGCVCGMVEAGGQLSGWGEGCSLTRTVRL